MRTYVYVNAYSPTRAGVHTAGGGQGQGLGLIFRSYITFTPRPNIYIYTYIHIYLTLLTHYTLPITHSKFPTNPFHQKLQGM